MTAALAAVPAEPSAEPACDLAAERAVLGAVLAGGCPVLAVLDDLKAGDFYRPLHTATFTAARRLHASGGPVDAVTVADELRRAGDLGRVGDEVYVAGLLDAAGATASARYHAEIVARHAVTRRLVTVGTRLAQQATGDPGAAAVTALADLQRLAPETCDAARSGGLAFTDVGALLAEVDAAGPPRWLWRGLWPADAYGIVAAEDKAGKTWAVLDAAVSVAAGTSWLGAYPCESAGPVLLFAGEGGARNLSRRLRAVADAHQVAAETLPIRVCLRVPHLGAADHLAAVAAEVARQRPRLVILDPLYLAAGGASGSDLYAMGAVLEGLQHICQRAGAALLVVTHFNKTGEGRGARRITGVGPGAWGRVLVAGHVEHRATDPAGRSTVVIGWDVTGGEVADTTVRIRRQVWSDDPGDLSAPLHYQAQPVSDDGPDGLARPVAPGCTPAAQRVHSVLSDADRPLTVQQIGDRLAEAGRPLQRRTIQQALADLDNAVDSLVVDARGTTSWTVAGAPAAGAS